jgi:hypothetical protein
VFKRTLQLLLAAWLTTGTLWAASDPLVGKWKLDPSQSKETDQMKIEAADPNRYPFDFGGGGTETIVVDGTEQPGRSGTTLSVTLVEPNTWKLVRKKDGYTVMQDHRHATDHAFSRPEYVDDDRPAGGSQQAGHIGVQSGIEEGAGDVLPGNHSERAGLSSIRRRLLARPRGSHFCFDAEDLLQITPAASRR